MYGRALGQSAMQKISSPSHLVERMHDRWRACLHDVRLGLDADCPYCMKVLLSQSQMKMIGCLFDWRRQVRRRRKQDSQSHWVQAVGERRTGRYYLYCGLA